MKLFLLWISFICLSASISAQNFTAAKLIDGIMLPKAKFENFVVRNNFIGTGNDYKGDTIIKEFKYRPKSKKDSIARTLSFYSTREDYSYLFTTMSDEEGQSILASFVKDGFFCNAAKDTLNNLWRLYQHNEYTVQFCKKPADTLMAYSFLLHRQELPKPKEIRFAEDLFAFTSHEYLRYYFGEENVKNDIYYLSEKKVGKCTVLFPNSSRQAVFLWEDELNNTTLSKIFIGGQLKTGGAVDYGQNIAENLWQLKSGIHPGMSLYTLRLLNNAAFNFYGGNNSQTGMIITDSTGKINFRRENVILGCMNCSDNNFIRQQVINSDDALEAERILFVHTIILQPERRQKTVN